MLENLILNYLNNKIVFYFITCRNVVQSGEKYKIQNDCVLVRSSPLVLQQNNNNVLIIRVDKIYIQHNFLSFNKKIF